MLEPSSWRAAESVPPIIAQFASPELDIAALIPGVTCAAVACCSGSLLHADNKSAAHPTKKAARITSLRIAKIGTNLCIIGTERAHVERGSAHLCTSETFSVNFMAKNIHIIDVDAPQGHKSKNDSAWVLLNFT